MDCLCYHVLFKQIFRNVIYLFDFGVTEENLFVLSRVLICVVISQSVNHLLGICF